MENFTLIEDRPAPFLVATEQYRGHDRGWAMYDPMAKRLMPLVQGGYDSPTYHPLGAPVISGTEITVDTMLQQPTRVTSFLMDISLQRFFADRILTSAGGVTGGAVVFDTVAANEIYLDNDIQQIAPGAPYPIVGSSRRAPGVAEVEKWGGRYPITWEARDRNDNVLFYNKNVQLSNTIVRKNNQRAVQTIVDAIAALSGAGTFPGVDWSATVPAGATPSAPASWPHSDLAKANMLADQRELGIRFNGLALNPVDYLTLVLIYKDQLANVLTQAGYNEAFSTNRVPTGTAYVYAEKQVGEMRVEKPLATRVYPDPDGIDQDWVQAGVRNVMFANNPYAVMSITGI